VTTVDGDLVFEVRRPSVKTADTLLEMNGKTDNTEIGEKHEHRND
jgi:hypothetical protein